MENEYKDEEDLERIYGIIGESSLETCVMFLQNWVPDDHSFVENLTVLCAVWPDLMKTNEWPVCRDKIFEHIKLKHPDKTNCLKGLYR